MVIGVEERLAGGVIRERRDTVGHRIIDLGEFTYRAVRETDADEGRYAAGVANADIDLLAILAQDGTGERAEPVPCDFLVGRDRLVAHRGEVGGLELVLPLDPVTPAVV